MNRRGVAFLCTTWATRPARLVTGHLAYVRFHGTDDRYAGKLPRPHAPGLGDWLRSQIPTSAPSTLLINDSAATP